MQKTRNDVRVKRKRAGSVPVGCFYIKPHRRSVCQRGDPAAGMAAETEDGLGGLAGQPAKEGGARAVVRKWQSSLRDATLGRESGVSGLP